MRPGWWVDSTHLPYLPGPDHSSPRARAGAARADSVGKTPRAGETVAGAAARGQGRPCLLNSAVLLPLAANFGRTGRRGLGVGAAGGLTPGGKLTPPWTRTRVPPQQAVLVVRPDVRVLCRR